MLEFAKLGRLFTVKLDLTPIFFHALPCLVKLALPPGWWALPGNSQCDTKNISFKSSCHLSVLFLVLIVQGKKINLIF